MKAVRFRTKLVMPGEKNGQGRKAFYTRQNYKSTPFFNLVGSMPVCLYDSINDRVFRYIPSSRIRKVLPTCCAEYRGIFRPTAATTDRAETQNHMREDVSSTDYWEDPGDWTADEASA